MGKFVRGLEVGGALVGVLTLTAACEAQNDEVDPTRVADLAHVLAVKGMDTGDWLVQAQSCVEGADEVTVATPEQLRQAETDQGMADLLTGVGTASDGTDCGGDYAVHGVSPETDAQAAARIMPGTTIFLKGLVERGVVHQVSWPDITTS